MQAVGKSVKNCHSMHYFLIIQPLAYMLKYNVSKTGSKVELLNQQNAAREKWQKWVSGITHTKFQGSA